MHFDKLFPVSVQKIKEVIELSKTIKEKQVKYTDSLKGKKLYELFEKTSTRTALSFSLAMTELGGEYFMQRYADSNFSIGEIQDEIRYVAKNVDVVLARLKTNIQIEKMVKFSPIPIINGCDDKYHPSQAIADMLTILEKFSTFDINLLYIGVWNNVVNSLVSTLPRLGGNLNILTPIINEASIDDEINRFAKESKNVNILSWQDYSNEDNLKTLIDEVDVVYVDTWIDMEHFNEKNYQEEKKQRINTMTPFKLTTKLFASSNTLIMHDMPIHPGFEIEREIVEKHIDLILHQAENRRHSAKGILHYLLNSY